MSMMKIVLASKAAEPLKAFTAGVGGLLFASTSETTDHLPFAAISVCATDNLDKARDIADAGLYLVYERNIKNTPLSELEATELPGSIGIFPMIGHPDLTALAADAHWRDVHAPLALDVHHTMTHYYQLSIQHVFSGPDLNGIALCCCANEDDLRNHFYKSPEGKRLIIEDIQKFADTKRSPRTVISNLIPL